MTVNTAVAADHHAPAITAQLARFVSQHPTQGWTDAVEHEAHRTFLNWLGCAIGAANHEAVDAALAAVQMLAPAPQATLAGRKERVDMANAALINGISSHTFDYDDTHLKTIIHPAGPVASAVMALAEHQSSSGRQVIDAIVLGIDVACRMGNLVYPEHYDRGWHITGSTGTLGARTVWHHDQAIPPRWRRTCWLDGCIDGPTRIHLECTLTRSTTRLGPSGVDQVRLARSTRRIRPTL